MRFAPGYLVLSFCLVFGIAPHFASAKPSDADCLGNQTTEGVRDCASRECIFSRDEGMSLVLTGEKRSYGERLFDYYRAWRAELKAVESYERKISSFESYLHALESEIRPLEKVVRNQSNGLPVPILPLKFEALLVKIKAASSEDDFADQVDDYFENYAGRFTAEQYVRLCQEVFELTFAKLPKTFSAPPASRLARGESIVKTILFYSRFIELSTEQKRKIAQLPATVFEGGANDLMGASALGALFAKIEEITYLPLASVNDSLAKLQKAVVDTRAALQEAIAEESVRKNSRVAP